MRGDHLQIEQLTTLCLQGSCSQNQCHGGRIPYPMEHRFSGEEVADFYAIQAASQLVVVPDFKGDGITHAVELAVCLNKGGTNPAFLPAFGRLGAATDHLIEGLVDGEGEFLASNRSLQSCWNVQLI